MKKTIWILWRPGEERVYAMAVQPSEPWATTQKKDGYFIASFDVELPDPTVSLVAAGPLQLSIGEVSAHSKSPTRFDMHGSVDVDCGVVEQLKAAEADGKLG